MKPAPRLARALLRIVLPPDERTNILEDLDEIWKEQLATRGRVTAALWYWSQALRSVRPSVTRRLTLRNTFDDGWSGGGENPMESLKQDVAFALKQLRRHPGVGILVVLTLALGIGATTAIFSAVNTVLLEPLPYDDPEELVFLTTEAGDYREIRFFSGPDLVDLRRQMESLQDVAVFSETTVGPMTDVERPAHVKVNRVSWNLFQMLGVDAALGRTFVAEDAIPIPQDTPPEEVPPSPAVIGHDFWMRAFGGDADVLGSMVRVWGGSTVIVGVLPEDLMLLAPPELNVGGDVELWRVMRFDPSQGSPSSNWYRPVARLAEGASLRQARQELGVFSNRLREVRPHHAENETRHHIASFTEAVAGPVRGPILVLMGAVTLVLLIACANVANLLLARGTARASEMAVRSSLGADSGRLVRQLLTESAFLALLGAGAGYLLAAGGVKALHLIRPPDLHRLADISLDLPVLAFALVAAAAATLLSGVLPALHAARSGIASGLGTRGVSGVGQRSRTLVVVTQVALSVVLVAGAGLLIRTFSELQRLPLGFEPGRLLTVTATQPSRPREERQAYEDELIRTVREVPGVSSAGIAFPLPMNGVYQRTGEYVREGLFADPTAWTVSYYRTVSPGYFEAMGLELRRGRDFSSADNVYEAPVVILDERIARREFPDRDPVGERLWIRGLEGDTLHAEIVGVVEYSPQWDHRDTRPTMYLPRVMYQSHEVSVVARVRGDPAGVAAAVSQAIRRVGPEFPADMAPMESFVSERLAASRFLLILMEVFAGVALVLSAVGIYGVLSYAVRQRSREFGIRLALGAVARSLTWRVVSDGASVASAGVVVGLVGALALGWSLRAQLFRVSWADPAALAGTTVVILGVAVLASLVPALRASRIDPVESLREE